MGSALTLRPTYWASISGGKDSFYMLYLILQNLDKYPLDGCVYFDLDIDYPFIKDVIAYIEAECKKHGITMFKIKPTHTWEEMYYSRYKTGSQRMRGYPSRISRWCNSEYKMSCDSQLKKMMKEQGKKVIYYIGFCADEERRFRFDLNNRDKNVTQIYPLAEAGIEESTILEWAKQQDIYNGYYKENRRCGCMCCPMSDFKSLVYTKTHYPEEYEHFMGLAKETEERMAKALGRPYYSVWSGTKEYNTEYKMRRVDQIIDDIENTPEQFSLFNDEWEGEECGDP